MSVDYGIKDSAFHTIVEMHKKIVIYGGAFNPPHKDHGKVIDVVLRHFPCDEIWVLPSPDRQDKKISVSGHHRLEMLKIMIKELFPHTPVPIMASDFELKRPDKPTTRETLTELKKLYPDTDFWFVVGSDTVGDIKTKWVNGKKLFHEANFLVVRRLGYGLPKELPPHTKVLDQSISEVDISSTAIRELAATGKDFSDHLVPAVAAYIKTRGLYKPR